MPNSTDIKLIAFYLPQFHPTETNNKFWGENFTEWTNVRKAKPLFSGHYAPRIPADLGYYDLREEQTRIAQAQMAKTYGIYGFCYYHYWFGRGRRELTLPFSEVLQSGNPDFPFMLCWANESWHTKFWDKDGKAHSKKLLVEQKYCGESDYTQHFLSILPAFKDKRYIKIDNKPLFMIYQPLQFRDIQTFITLWQNLAKQNGLEGIIFIGQTQHIDSDYNIILEKGFDFVNSVNFYNALKQRSLIKKIYDSFRRNLFNTPFIASYANAVKFMITKFEYNENVLPCVLPNWDHTARSGKNGYVLTNSTPELWGELLKNTFKIVTNKPQNKQIIFIKSWNEWAEGNHLEPDSKFGKRYLQELKKNIDC
jgi:lipopolysaccharide biosynthesis protein